MKVKTQKKLLFSYSALAGLMDVLSGCLLMTLPTVTLELMCVAPVPPEVLPFIRFIGAFVFGVGALYWFALVPVMLTGRWGSVGQVFLITSWLRGVIFVFGSIAILVGCLSADWLTVPLTDGVLAILQLWFLFRFREVEL